MAEMHADSALPNYFRLLHTLTDRRLKLRRSKLIDDNHCPITGNARLDTLVRSLCQSMDTERRSAANLIYWNLDLHRIHTGQIFHCERHFLELSISPPFSDQCLAAMFTFAWPQSLHFRVSLQTARGSTNATRTDKVHWPQVHMKLASASAANCTLTGPSRHVIGLLCTLPLVDKWPITHR